ncbi:hypothetical protein GCM10010185_42090 [Saccharothrix coeruleofusca]|uniref:Uncharacterized protein n=1 Tax=Saccharothrix coeruleofusca TaxID=33919 RepID=A0A918EFG6_9PSEU|nr:hypothetical protein GCM10010185_42090 [Saccharothrix coeruleofusca]
MPQLQPPVAHARLDPVQNAEPDPHDALPHSFLPALSSGFNVCRAPAQHPAPTLGDAAARNQGGRAAAQPTPKGA